MMMPEEADIFDDGEQFMRRTNERGETRRMLEQSTAEAVLFLLDQFCCPENPVAGEMYDRVSFCLEQWRKCRGLLPPSTP